MIDAHIHLDQYSDADIKRIVKNMQFSGIEGLVCVSTNLESSMANLALAERYPGIIHPAFGYHPENPLPDEEEVSQLLSWMEREACRMIAVGEIGLPYYLRRQMAKEGRSLDLDAYVQLLERFLSFAGQYGKPVVLHAVYEDADLACDLLERYRIRKAHFHWFKGAKHTLRTMFDRGYYISFTPDLLYELEIMELARSYPPDQVMAETDGPWLFEGPFAGQLTQPAMVLKVAEAWAAIQGIAPEEARCRLRENTKRFYGI
ncbi:TatD family hydrolase [Paenibacillus woosongensis]|uniref:TatD family hydrolase n=1 Tax=Paenibacillus woosongensis TaxID=307580 RepID=A0AA95I576_9BACL|nr:TatD family hydrolase [Paenibacillus woosongensis]WHX49686.1 TatD family hydrolase [Paenibacillus woosongensis]